MKESYRVFSSEIEEGKDILFVARNSINGVKCKEVEASMIRALKRGKLLK